MIRFIALALPCLSLLLAAGCSDDFNPKVDFKEELVVYCALNTADSVQYVRLETTYDAELGNITGSSGRKVEQAKVEIREGSSLYVFRDTLIAAEGGSYKRVWYHPSLRPKANKEYRLKIDAGGFPVATSAVKMPSTAQCDFKIWHTKLYIDSMQIYSGANYYVIEPKGYTYRLDLVYRDTIDGQFVEKRIRVPVGENTETNQYLYPGVSRESNLIFQKSFLRTAALQFGIDKSQWYKIGAMGYMYNLDADFYNYYKLVRGFDDPRTVRLDQPDYTNINGARGIFGAINVDSVYVDLLQFYRLQ